MCFFKKMMKTISLNASVIFGSSEAFFGPVFHCGNVLSVPYANVGLLNHEFDGLADPWIDKCLFVSYCTTQFRRDDQITTVGGTSEEGFVVLGGESMVSPPPWCEADFYSKNAELILFEDSQISETPFTISEAELHEFLIETDWQTVWHTLFK